MMMYDPSFIAGTVVGAASFGAGVVAGVILCCVLEFWAQRRRMTERLPPERL
jgi:hypothetical protein